jgi:hypothetical protein
VLAGQNVKPVTIIKITFMPNLIVNAIVGSSKAAARALTNTLNTASSYSYKGFKSVAAKWIIRKIVSSIPLSESQIEFIKQSIALAEKNFLSLNRRLYGRIMDKGYLEKEKYAEIHIKNLGEEICGTANTREPYDAIVSISPSCLTDQTTAHEWGHVVHLSQNITRKNNLPSKGFIVDGVAEFLAANNPFSDAYDAKACQLGPTPFGNYSLSQLLHPQSKEGSRERYRLGPKAIQSLRLATEAKLLAEAEFAGILTGELGGMYFDFSTMKRVIKALPLDLKEKLDGEALVEILRKKHHECRQLKIQADLKNPALNTFPSSLKNKEWRDIYRDQNPEIACLSRFNKVCNENNKLPSSFYTEHSFFGKLLRSHDFGLGSTFFSETVQRYFFQWAIEAAYQRAGNSYEVALQKTRQLLGQNYQSQYLNTTQDLLTSFGFSANDTDHVCTWEARAQFQGACQEVGEAILNATGSYPVLGVLKDFVKKWNPSANLDEFDDLFKHSGVPNTYLGASFEWIEALASGLYGLIDSAVWNFLEGVIDKIASEKPWRSATPYKLGMVVARSATAAMLPMVLLGPAAVAAAGPIVLSSMLGSAIVGSILRLSIVYSAKEIISHSRCLNTSLDNRYLNIAKEASVAVLPYLGNCTMFFIPVRSFLQNGANLSTSMAGAMLGGVAKKLGEGVGSSLAKKLLHRFAREESGQAYPNEYELTKVITIEPPTEPEPIQATADGPVLVKQLPAAPKKQLLAPPPPPKPEQLKNWLETVSTRADKQERIGLLYNTPQFQDHSSPELRHKMLTKK